MIAHADISELQRFERNFREYVRLRGKDSDELLNLKSNDLRIQLAKEFRQVRWKPGGKGQQGKGKGFVDMRRRAKAGIGTNIRKLVPVSTVPEVDKNGRPLSKWQQLVYSEIHRRQSGAGFLGATFLSKRYKTDAKGRRFLTENRSRTAGLLLRIERSGDSVTLRGFTPGLDKINRKYGIVNRALRNVNSDIETYLKRKNEEIARRTLNR